MAVAQFTFQPEPFEYTSPEESLRLEPEAESKHEYFQGKIRLNPSKPVFPTNPRNPLKSKQTRGPYKIHAIHPNPS